MRLAPIATGALSLIALQVLVTSPQSGRLAELLVLPAAWAKRLIDPNVPAISDRSGSASTTQTSAAAPATTPGTVDWSTTTI